MQKSVWSSMSCSAPRAFGLSQVSHNQAFASILATVETDQERANVCDLNFPLISWFLLCVVLGGSRFGVTVRCLILSNCPCRPSRSGGCHVCLADGDLTALSTDALDSINFHQVARRNSAGPAPTLLCPPANRVRPAIAGPSGRARMKRCPSQRDPTYFADSSTARAMPLGGEADERAVIRQTLSMNRRPLFTARTG